jgi:hypothetical protein
VLASTNLALGFAPISPVIPATSASTTFFDSTSAAEKFYLVEMVK